MSVISASAQENQRDQIALITEDSFIKIASPTLEIYCPSLSSPMIEGEAGR